MDKIIEFLDFLSNSSEQVKQSYTIGRGAARDVYSMGDGYNNFVIKLPRFVIEREDDIWCDEISKELVIKRAVKQIETEKKVWDGLENNAFKRFFNPVLSVGEYKGIPFLIVPIVEPIPSLLEHYYDLSAVNHIQISFAFETGVKEVSKEMDLYEDDLFTIENLGVDGSGNLVVIDYGTRN